MWLASSITTEALAHTDRTMSAIIEQLVQHLNLAEFSAWQNGGLAKTASIKSAKHYDPCVKQCIQIIATSVHYQ